MTLWSATVLLASWVSALGPYLADRKDAPRTAEAGTLVILDAAGEDQTLTLRETMPIDGKPAQLEGLLGSVAVGFKLFPASTLAEGKFAAADADK
jgi:hypothetical protein